MQAASPAAPERRLRQRARLLVQGIDAAPAAEQAETGFDAGRVAPRVQADRQSAVSGPRNVAASRRDRERQAREAFRRARDKASFLFSKEYNRHLFRVGMEGQPIEWLLAAAREGDPDALEILRDRVRAARRSGTALPP